MKNTTLKRGTGLFVFSVDSVRIQGKGKTYQNTKSIFPLKDLNLNVVTFVRNSNYSLIRRVNNFLLLPSASICFNILI